MAKKLQLMGSLGGGGGPSGPVAWDDITGKPFTKGGSGTIVWDGNLEGKTYIEEDGMVLVKISSTPLTKSDVSAGFSIAIPGTPGTAVSGEEAQAMFLEDGAFFIDVLFSFPYDNYVLDGIVIPEKGIWTFMPEMFGVSNITITFPGYTGFGTEKLSASALGANIVYASNDGNDKYLYRTADTSTPDNRITAVELNGMYCNGKTTIVRSHTDSAIFNNMIAAYAVIEGYGLAILFNGSNDVTYHTAEYTPPATTGE